MTPEGQTWLRDDLVSSEEEGAEEAKNPGLGGYQHAKHNLGKTLKSHMGKTGLKNSLGKAYRNE